MPLHKREQKATCNAQPEGHMPSLVRLLVPFLLQMYVHSGSVCFGACLRGTSAGEAAKSSLPAMLVHRHKKDRCSAAPAISCCR